MECVFVRLRDGIRGKAQLVALYSGLPVPELKVLLQSVFGEDVCNVVGFEGADGTAIPISVACQHPESLTAEEYLILSNTGNKSCLEIDHLRRAWSDNLTGSGQASKMAMIVDALVILQTIQ